MGEVWKDIPEFEGLYQVSNLGRLRSVGREVVDSLGRKRLHKGKILSAKGISSGGYRQISLRKDGKVFTKDVHRIVAQVFVENKGGKKCVNHIDCDKLNNRADNLEWCSYKENDEHSWKNNRRLHGENCSFAKLSNEDMLEVYRLAHESKLSHREIAARFGIHKGHVSKIKLGTVGARVTGHKYEETGRGKGSRYDAS